MKIRITTLVLCISLLAGCSNSHKEFKYDEVDLIHYKACLDKFMSSSTSNLYADAETSSAIDYCKKFLPVKR